MVPERREETLNKTDLLRRLARFMQRGFSAGPLVLRFQDGSEKTIPGDMMHLDAVYEAVEAKVVAAIADQPAPKSPLDEEVSWLLDCTEILDEHGTKLWLLHRNCR